MAENKRGRRIVETGIVRSAKMDKTAVVEIEQLVKHPVYHKYVRRKIKYYAHDPENSAHEGDKVEIVQTRPLSKLKRWRLVKVLTAER